MNKKLMMITLGSLSLLASPLSAKASANTARFVDFRKCFLESNFGKQEQERFQEMQTQMEKSIKDLTAQLTEVQEKLNDEDVRDALSKKAEEELQEKQNTLTAELQRYQMQFPQILQQAQSQSFYMVREKAKNAATELATEKKLGCILSEDQAFFYKAELDVTAQVIEKLNKLYEKESQEASAKAELEKNNEAK